MQPKAEFADCENCPLLDCEFVPSHIPDGAILIAVGEAPGKDEVASQQPFTGPSGQLLDRTLAHAGLPLDRLAKTNAVLCRPQGNATPPHAAVWACNKRLAHDLNRGPHTVLALGTTAREALANLSHKASETMHANGQWFSVGHFNVLPTYHPAYVLRQPDAMSTLLNDTARVVRKANGMQAQPFNTDALKYIVCDDNNKARVIEHLNRMPNGAVLAFDVETDFLEWHDTPTQPKADLLAIGLSYRQNQVVIIPSHMFTDLALFECLHFAFSHAKIVAHNGKFDLEVLQTHLGFKHSLTYDTMLAHYVLQETQGGHGLKDLVKTWLEYNDDYEDRLIHSWFRTNKIKKEDQRYSMIPKAQLYEYLAIDVAATFALWPLLEAELKRQNLFDDPFNNTLMPIANAIQHVEQNGIKIDRPYLQQVDRYLEQDVIPSALAAIREIVTPLVAEWLQNGKIVVPKANWIKDKTVYAKCVTRMQQDFNPGSWQQVQVLLYDILKLQHMIKLGYDTDPRSTGKECLISLAPNDSSGFISALRLYRRYKKIQGTYVQKLLELADINNRVHIGYIIHGTEVGRLSASDAMHGIPRPGDDEWGKVLRGAFIADEGNTLVIADYSQAELRAFAAESREPFLLTIFNEDRDPHGEANKMLFEGDPIVDAAVYDKETASWFWLDIHLFDKMGLNDIKSYWKERRTTAKNVVFGGLVYLGGATGIAGMLGGALSANQIKPILDRLLAQMPTARAWQQEQFRKARTQGYVQSRFGRKRRFPLIVDSNLDEVKKACVHMQIAADASDLTLLTIVEVDKWGWKVVGTWHDSLIIECKKEHAEQCARFVQQTMIDMGERYFPEVKWAAEVEIQERWYMERPEFTIS